MFQRINVISTKNTKAYYHKLKMNNRICINCYKRDIHARYKLPQPSYIFNFIRPFSDNNSNKSATKSTNNPPAKKEGKVLDKLIGERLPIPLAKAEDEFPPAPKIDSFQFRKQQGTRVYNIATSRIVQPRFVAFFGLSLSTVFGIGFVEAAHLCQEIPFIESFEAGKYCVLYGIEQIIPSCIWSSQDPVLIAKAHMGADDPYDSLLHQFINNARDAQVQLRVHTLSAFRSVFASFMMLAQLVNVVNGMARAGDVYKDHIYEGKEPPFSGVTQRVFRFCGQNSDVTSLSLERYGHHIFPLFEDPKAIPNTINIHSNFGKVPMFWHIDKKYYGYRHTYRNFPVNNESFITASTGRKILYFESDATNSDDPMALDDSYTDLTLDHASQGQRVIEAKYKQSQEVSMHRVFRVFLGNTSIFNKTGSGKKITVRQRIEKTHEMDVVIDARAAVFTDLLRWCARVTKDRKKREIILSTSDKKYFNTLKLWLKGYGYDIYDVDEEQRRLSKIKEAAAKEEAEAGVENDNNHAEAEKVTGNEHEETIDKDKDNDDKAPMPKIIYYKTTAETVNAVYALAKAKEIHAESTCVMVDKMEGAKALHSLQSYGEGGWEDKAVKEAVDNGLHVVCSAVIFDDLLRQVRGWARLGHSAKEIQAELDVRFKDALDTLAYQQLDE